MKRTTKMLIAAMAVVLGVVIGTVLMVQSQSESLGEDTIRAMVTDRYSGQIRTIETEGSNYIVHVEDDGFEYEITMDREDGRITAMDSRKIAVEEAAEGSTETEGAEKTPEDETTEASVEDTTEEPTEESAEKPAVQVTEAEAKALALEEVGGQFVHVALNEEIHPAEYQVIQLVEDDDEGALVSIDAQAGEVTKVLWFSIDFEDITDIEAFAQELQNYNTQYQNNYYIEFDNDSGTDTKNGEDTDAENDMEDDDD
ncbi:hypothetical protein J4760_10755 [Salinicoccus sp. ID82-1]|uniref:hypothetical protein n=1 Tax=Salinicoccus sp. ID82-1 TaxID=2820269 RepID=UPI001F202CE7|nr:hypothetical protein [Salinicoccus sp. ID82-1]MCG1010499.1 hypothetical protein [Salinicoccus sp. ID82-1]